MDTNELINLVLLAKQKDTKAFAMLYEEIYMDLYRYAYYTLKNPYDAEDVVSDTVTDAFYGIHSLKKPESFKSWIFTILSAKCKRKLKSYTKKTIPLDEELPSMEPIFENETIIRQDIRKALLQLSDIERIIINLSIIVGFSSKEIGIQLHINHNTVRSIQSRALMKLKKILMD